MNRIVIFFLRRLGYSVLILLGLSIVIFVITRVVPGDPARLALGNAASIESVERLSRALHLHEPLYGQYYHWIKGVLAGDFGKSLFSRGAVIDDIKRTLPATLELCLFAMLISIIIGQLLGICAGYWHGTWIDSVARIIAYVGVVTPNFVLALVFLLIFGHFTRLLPMIGRLSGGLSPPTQVTGMYTIDSLLAGRFDIFVDAIKHMVLPAIAVAWASIAQESRITRAAMSRNLSADYIASDRAAGFPRRIILFKYLLRPSLVPTISIMGPDLAFIVVNAFLVEQVFNWPGFARYGLQTILAKDLNAVIAVVLILGSFFVLANIIADLIVAFLDPRLRFRRGR